MSLTEGDESGVHSTPLPASAAHLRPQAAPLGVLGGTLQRNPAYTGWGALRFLGLKLKANRTVLVPGPIVIGWLSGGM